MDAEIVDLYQTGPLQWTLVARPAAAVNDPLAAVDFIGQVPSETVRVTSVSEFEANAVAGHHFNGVNGTEG